LTPTWARNTTPLVTTSGYTSGLQKFTNYSDNTPDVATAYDASGRVSTITQASQSRIAYTYDPADLALGTETVSSDLDHNGTDEFTRTLDRS
jgi:YD repeat-containing protein